MEILPWLAWLGVFAGAIAAIVLGVMAVSKMVVKSAEKKAQAESE